ncbi:MAG: hypothetical protein IT364_18685 [Candidatus Hydrogenedentes bacterium]|nr:hypothetical protein [Candidatus Hydrogenedentota bacterium]
MQTFMLVLLVGGPILALLLLLREDMKPLSAYRGRTSGLSTPETYVVAVHRFIQYAMLIWMMLQEESPSEAWQADWPLAFSLFVLMLGLTYVCVGLLGRPRMLNLSIAATLAGGGARPEREGRASARFLNVFMGTCLIVLALTYSIPGL